MIGIFLVGFVSARAEMNIGQGHPTKDDIFFLRICLGGITKNFLLLGKIIKFISVSFLPSICLIFSYCCYFLISFRGIKLSAINDFIVEGKFKF